MGFQRKQGFYEKYVKRCLDIVCSLLAIVCFCWLYVILAVIVRLIMGSPILFKQPRPGIIDQKTGKEKIFNMYKFRTMTNERDEQGNLLPEEQRLPQFGRILRAMSLDELPEVFNILKGDMSIVGPRPQLVRDMVFMNDRQRMRHTAKPGLSGLAQVMGRNAISWEDKINWDLKYIKHVSFRNDLKIVGLTIRKVLGAKETDVAETAVTLDYGDALLQSGKITQETYDALQERAKRILEDRQ